METQYEGYREGWVKYPTEFMVNKSFDRSKLAGRLFGCIYNSFMKCDETVTCTASDQRLAYIMRCHPRTVGKMLKRFVAEGYFTITHQNKERIIAINPYYHIQYSSQAMEFWKMMNEGIAKNEKEGEHHAAKGHNTD